MLQLACPRAQFMCAFGPHEYGLDVTITFLNYDIKNLIVMQKVHSNKPT